MRFAICRRMSFQLWPLIVVRDRTDYKIAALTGTAVLLLNLIWGVEHGGFEPPTPCLPGKGGGYFGEFSGSF